MTLKWLPSQTFNSGNHATHTLPGVKTVAVNQKQGIPLTYVSDTIKYCFTNLIFHLQ